MADINISQADISRIRLVAQASAPSAPDADSGVVYLGTDNVLHVRLDDGTILDIGPNAAAGFIGAHVYRSTSQTGVTNGVATLVDWTAAYVNTGEFDLDNDNFTVAEAGTYAIHFNLCGFGTTSAPALQYNRGGTIEHYENRQIIYGSNRLCHFTIVRRFAAEDVLTFYGTVAAGNQFYVGNVAPLELAIWRLDD